MSAPEPPVPRRNLVRDGVCPFCDLDLSGKGAIPLVMQNSLARVDCPVCGSYDISGAACDAVPHWELSDQKRAAIAFTIRRMTDRPERARLSLEVLRQVRDTAVLPRPERLLDEAVLWLGRHSEHVGQLFAVDYPEYRSVLGVWNVAAFNFMTESLAKSPYVSALRSKGMGDAPLPLSGCYLTPAGWRRYTELSRHYAESRYGFMAMKYGDSELDTIVKDHFATEVRKTDFDLRRLDEGQPAGLIDDQLRVLIRTSRFLVCDLTHGNKGAYWEAGFAEGLGKPVIYTCRRDVFDDRENPNHPHFDTNHMVTVIWESADPAAAAKRLKDTIRATLPGEARLMD
jgi:hypothetical protein